MTFADRLPSRLHDLRVSGAGEDQPGLAVKAELVRPSTEDRTISPELERFMAERMKTKTIEVKASHLSLISHPQEITDLILSTAADRPVCRASVSARAAGRQ